MVAEGALLEGGDVLVQGLFFDDDRVLGDTEHYAVSVRKQLLKEAKRPVYGIRDEGVAGRIQSDAPPRDVQLYDRLRDEPHVERVFCLLATLFGIAFFHNSTIINVRAGFGYENQRL